MFKQEVSVEDCCAPLASEPLTDAGAADLAPLFKAVADPVRLRLLSLIACHEGGESCVCELTDAFDMTGPAVSYHLRILREAGLISSERRGTWVYYRVNPPVMARMSAVLVPAPAVPAEAVGLREQVRSRYAGVALTVLGNPDGEGGCCDASGCCAPGSDLGALTGAAGASLYRDGETDGLPQDAVTASLGCGNPLAVAELRDGERVLDLGSGGGIDVLLSARRVGPSGHAYGVDMTGEMLALARANAQQAGAGNVTFLKGQIEAVPLPAASVDVVISNCVINLSTDKPAVLAEMFRVLVPGGRIGISDVVAEDHLNAADRAAAGSYVGCIAGALSKSEYLAGLAAAGFASAEVTFTHEAAPGMHSAIVRAVKPSA